MSSNEIPRRAGAAPAVSTTDPPEQLMQNAPKHLQERLLLLATGLWGVLARPSDACTPGSTALHLAPKLARGPVAAFPRGTEFAHMHPHYDGSVHLSLPPEVAKAAQGAGWGLFDVRTGTFLMYGPRDWDELAVEWAFVNCSYRFARDLPDPNALLIEDVSD